MVGNLGILQGVAPRQLSACLQQEKEAKFALPVGKEVLDQKVRGRVGNYKNQMNKDTIKQWVHYVFLCIKNWGNMSLIRIRYFKKRGSVIVQIRDNQANDGQVVLTFYMTMLGALCKIAEESRIRHLECRSEGCEIFSISEKVIASVGSLRDEIDKRAIEVKREDEKSNQGSK